MRPEIMRALEDFDRKTEELRDFWERIYESMTPAEKEEYEARMGLDFDHRASART